MKQTTDFSVGDKVIPKDKSVGKPYSVSHPVMRAKQLHQDFLYVTSIDHTDGVVICSHIEDGWGDYFLPSDLEFYDEQDENKELDPIDEFLKLFDKQDEDKELEPIDVLDEGIYLVTNEFQILVQDGLRLIAERGTFDKLIDDIQIQGGRFTDKFSIVVEGVDEDGILIKFEEK